MTHHPTHEVELYREGGSYRVFVDMPGFDCDDIDVQWRDRRLSITAERRVGSPRQSRTFRRRVSVPRASRPEDITARYRDGVLEVVIPIADRPESPGDRIEVRG